MRTVEHSSVLSLRSRSRYPCTVIRDGDKLIEMQIYGTRLGLSDCKLEVYPIEEYARRSHWNNEKRKRILDELRSDDVLYICVDFHFSEKREWPGHWTLYPAPF